MKLLFHGGAKEVGRQCIEVQSSQTRFLLDAGVKLAAESEYPLEIKNIEQIQGAITSHGHLDHCGSWPYLHSKGLNCPIYMTAVTREIAKILLRDFYKVESLTHIPPYPKEAIYEVFDQFRTANYKQGYQVNDVYFKFFDAGHIPGSSYVLLEADGKRLVYTGDINLQDSRLLKGAQIEVRDVDALIMETTYGNRNHPDRKQTEKEFLAKVKETINRGGKVFIPAFSVGRSQELMLLLTTEKWNVPIYLDGMGKDMTEIILRSDSAKDIQALKQARNKVKFVSGPNERRDAIKKQGIFIASAGMMTGGSIIEYIKEGHQDPRNSILITGYVDTGTNGRLLLDEGSIFIEGRKTKVKAEYHQYDFSAHSGLNELIELVKKINPQKVILVHGDAHALENFANLVKKMGKEVFIPSLQSEINI